MSDPKFIFVLHKILGTQIFMSSQVIGFGLLSSGGAGAGVQTYLYIYLVPLC